jgi:hypothetical protein
MKRVILIVVAMLAMTLMAFAPVLQGDQPPTSLVQSFVQLPDAIRLGITALVIAVVGLVFMKIGELFPWAIPFLTKYKEEISLVLAGALIGWIENALPGGAYENISLLVVQIVLAVLALIGLFRTLAKAGVKGFRAA